MDESREPARQDEDRTTERRRGMSPVTIMAIAVIVDIDLILVWLLFF